MNKITPKGYFQKTSKRPILKHYRLPCCCYCGEVLSKQYSLQRGIYSGCYIHGKVYGLIALKGIDRVTNG